MRHFSLPTVSSQAHCHISVSSSLPSAGSQMRLSTHHENVGALIRYHQYSNVSSIHVYHRLHSGLGMCVGTPNSITRNEVKVNFHARYLAVVLDSRVPVAFPSATDFTPWSSWQVSQVVRLDHCSALCIVWPLLWNRSCCLSLYNLRIRSDFRHLHFDSSALHQERDRCRCTLDHSDPCLTRVPANSTLPPSSNRSFSAAIRATLGPAAVWTLETLSGWREHFNIETVERTL